MSAPRKHEEHHIVTFECQRCGHQNAYRVEQYYGPPQPSKDLEKATIEVNFDTIYRPYAGPKYSN